MVLTNQLLTKSPVSGLRSLIVPWTPPKIPNKIQPCFRHLQRHYSEAAQRTMKVTLIGAAGSLGQSLALMLKQSSLIDEVCLQDVRPTRGIAKELQQIDTKCIVTSYCGSDNLDKALKGSRVVVLLAAKRRTSYLSYDNMFEYNAPIIRDVTKEILRFNPKAFLVVATNPVNSLVPLISELFKKSGHYDPKMIFGATTLDCIRTNTLAADAVGLEPECVQVPVIGGHSEHTTVPVLSKTTPCNQFTNEELQEITSSVKKGHEIMVKVKKDEGAKLSQAFALARFVISLVKAQQGASGIIEYAYVKSKDTRVKYLANALQIGPSGVSKNFGTPDDMSEYEECQLENAIDVLREDIKRGEMFVGVIDPPPCDFCDPNPKAPRCPPDPCDALKKHLEG